MIPPFRRARVQSSLKKSLQNIRLKRSGADAMAWLSYVLFMKTLAAESQNQAVSEKCKVIEAHHVRAARKIVLKKLRG